MKRAKIAAALILAGCAPIVDDPAPMPGHGCVTCEQMIEPERVGFFDVCESEIEAFVEMEKCRIEHCDDECPHSLRELGIDCAACLSLQCTDAYVACVEGPQP